MPKIIRAIFLASILLGWGIPFALQQADSKETLFHATVLVPTASLDLSDLDVRDAHNRKVTSLFAREQLKSLFVNGLGSLLTFNLTPAAQVVLELMTRSWNLFDRWFGRAANRFANVFTAWVQSKKDYFKGVVVLARQGFSSSAGAGVSVGTTQGHALLISSIISSTQILR